MEILNNRLQLAVDFTAKLNPYGLVDAFINGNRLLLLDNPAMYIRCGYTYYAQFLFDDLEMPKGSSWMYRQDFYSPGKLPKFYKDKPHITAKDFGVIDIKGCTSFEEYLGRLKRDNRRKVKSLQIYDVNRIDFGPEFLEIVEKAKSQLDRLYKGKTEETIVEQYNNLKAHTLYAESKYDEDKDKQPYLLEMSSKGKVVGYALSFDLFSERGVVCVNCTDILTTKGYNVKDATASCINWAIERGVYSYLDISNALGMDDPKMFYKHQFYTSIGGERETVELYFDSQETIDEYLKVNWKAYGTPFEIDKSIVKLKPLTFLGTQFKKVVSKDSYDIYTCLLENIKGSCIREIINYLRVLNDPDAPELDTRIIPLIMTPNSVMDLLTTKDGYLLSMTISYPVDIHKKSYLSSFLDPSIFKDAWYLDEMYTPIDERKKGYAKILLTHTLKDKPNISLTVAENNPAILLYKGLDFKLLDRVPNYYPNLTSSDPYNLTGLTLYRNVNN